MLLRALLTLARAWVIAGQPKPNGLASFGGFDRWVQVIGGVLQHAGLTGFCRDPEQAYVDPDAEQWLPFLQAVGDVTYWQEFTVAELSKIAQDVQWSGSRNVPSKNAAKLRDNIPAELAKSVDTPKFTAELGYAFRKKRNAYYGPDNIHVAHTGNFTRDGAALWQVRLANQTQAGSAAQAASAWPSSSSSTLSSPTSSATSASSSSAPPTVGEIRYFKGKPYRFDGKNWVKQ